MMASMRELPQVVAGSRELFQVGAARAAHELTDRTPTGKHSPVDSSSTAMVTCTRLSTPSLAIRRAT